MLANTPPPPPIHHGFYETTKRIIMKLSRLHRFFLGGRGCPKRDELENFSRINDPAN